MKLPVSPLAPESFPDLPPVRGVTAAVGSRGFYAPRGLERNDVFLVRFAEGTITAGVFTRSTTASADVNWCRRALMESEGRAGALLVNSGNSNAFTGVRGVEKNEASLAALVEALKVDRAGCYLAATGVIGEPLPDPNYVGVMVPELAARLAPPDWKACAQAFMTTDTFPKGAGGVFELDGAKISMAGIAKGSGMIAPNMATMLAYIFTDVAIVPGLLDELVREAADLSFNCVTVDSDMSTSDTFMVFATGASGIPPITDRSDPRCAVFADALNKVALDLALQLVRDGEGATKFVSIAVSGAASDISAKRIACAIANSPLVKTALAAGDANWGRVVMAVGKAMEPVDQAELEIWFGDVQVAQAGGRAPSYDEVAASAVCAQSHIPIQVRVGGGQGEAVVYTCDLTHGYVDINGAYRT